VAPASCRYLNGSLLQESRIHNMTHSRLLLVTIILTADHMTSYKTDCHNIHALLHCLFHTSFLHSSSRKSVSFIYRSPVIWLYYVEGVPQAQCSILSSASACTSYKTRSVSNSIITMENGVGPSHSHNSITYREIMMMMMIIIIIIITIKAHYF
jgi:hypothetical protein